MDPSRTKSKALPAIALPALALLALVLFVYSPAASAGFIWDDDKYVTENRMLTAPDGLKQIWFSAHTQSQYFPLVFTTFRLERMLWGLEPRGYHLVNIFLHGINAGLLWVLLRRLKVPGSWMAAALFAVHPVHVESVAWITELKNVESLFFFLLTLLAWLAFTERMPENQLATTPGSATQLAAPRAPEPSGKTLQATRCSLPPFWFYLLALVLYLMALFAKTTACTLPAAMVLLVFLRRERFSWGRIAQICPFVVLGAAMGLVSVWWEGHLGAYEEGIGTSLSPAQRVMLAARALWFYAAKLLWPSSLTFSYPHWQINPSEPVQYLPVLAVCLVVILLWIGRKRLGRGVLVALIFFVAMLAPLLGFVSNYTFVYSFVADHYQYTASIGLFALCAAVLASNPVRRLLGPSLRWGIQVAILAVFGLLTQQQCRAYVTAETLWRDTLAKNPGSWMAHYNLGLELQAQGKLSEAIAEYQAAIALNAKHSKAHNNLGLALAEVGRLGEAKDHYNAALKLDPRFTAAHNNLALVLARAGDYEQAVVHLRQALQLQPDSVGMLLNLGNFLKTQGKGDEAVQCFRRASMLAPKDVRPLRYLAATLFESSQFDQAASAYRQALELSPDQLDLLIDLGNTLVSQTNYDGALALYRRADELAPDNAGIHRNMGEVLALQGKTREAKLELREALRLKPDFAQAEESLLMLTIKEADATSRKN